MFGLFQSKKEKQDNLLRKGMAAMASGQLDAAEGYFLKAVELDIFDSAEAWIGLGALYLSVEMNSKAKDCFVTALSQKPNDYHAIRGMAIVERQIGNDEHAVELFKQLQAKYGYNPYEDPTQTSNQDWFRSNGF